MSTTPRKQKKTKNKNNVIYVNHRLFFAPLELLIHEYNQSIDQAIYYEDSEEPEDAWLSEKNYEAAETLLRIIEKRKPQLKRLGLELEHCQFGYLSYVQRKEA